MRIRRDARGPGAYLEWRVRLMGAGAIVALIGFWADANWLVNVAIALLFVGFMLRFAGREGTDEGEGLEEPDADGPVGGPDAGLDPGPDADGPD